MLHRCEIPTWEFVPDLKNLKIRWRNPTSLSSFLVLTIPYSNIQLTIHMDPVSRRLLKELSDFQRDTTGHSDILELQPVDDENLLNWKAVMRGARDTAYEGMQDILFT